MGATINFSAPPYAPDVVMALLLAGAWVVVFGLVILAVAATTVPNVDPARWERALHWIAWTFILAVWWGGAMLLFGYYGLGIFVWFGS